MSALTPESRTPVPADADPAPPNPTERLRAPRTRRALLAGLAGGAGALIAGAVGRLNPARAVAAAGTPLYIGRTDNNAGTADTQLLTNSSITAFTLYQQGPGTALMGYVTRTSGNGRGVYGRTDSPNGDGVQARNNASSAGSGAAIRAFGVNNDGIVASTANASKAGVTATNTDTTADNVAVMGLAYNASSADTHPAGAITVFKAAGEFAGVTGVIGASIPGVPAGAGVVGMSPGTGGYGVYGYATSTTGMTNGVYGRTDSTSDDAAGVSGFATANSGSSSYGVHGLSAGSAINAAGVKGLGTGSGGNGVWAECTAVGGYGVYAVGASDGIGVYTSGGNYGIWSSGDCHVVGDFVASGSKAGYVVDVAVNGSAEALRTGRRGHPHRRAARCTGGHPAPCRGSGLRGRSGGRRRRPKSRGHQGFTEAPGCDERNQSLGDDGRTGGTPVCGYAGRLCGGLGRGIGRCHQAR